MLHKAKVVKKRRSHEGALGHPSDSAGRVPEAPLLQLLRDTWPAPSGGHWLVLYHIVRTAEDAFLRLFGRLDRVHGGGGCAVYLCRCKRSQWRRLGLASLRPV
jgi:hypothetical protein